MATRRQKGRTYSAASFPNDTNLGYFRSLLLMLCIFVLMMILAGICAGLAMGMFPADSRDGILAANVVQNVVAFFGSALMTSFFISSRPFAFLGCLGRLKPLTVFNILICFILGFPFLNEIVYLNAHMHLPQWLAGVEHWMRELENNAGAQVETLLNVHSVGALLVNILIIGVLTGFCEEIFFRGTLQRVLGSHGVNRHLAVWLAAFIFSLLHFQFFGFLPRLLLGAFFGYILLWTGSIWASATAHAIFNSITVVEVWLLHRGVNAKVVEEFGVQTNCFPWIACVSLALVLIYIFVQRRHGF